MIYHFKTIIQIERINQSFKQYLQYYVNNIQNNQIIVLLIVKLDLNKKILGNIKVIQFFAYFRKKSYLFKNQKIIS